MRRYTAVIALLAIFIVVLHACEVDAPLPADQPYELKLPKGFPAMNMPEDNPLTVKGVELGRMLFYDPILSGDSTMSCASCHNLSFSFSDNGKRYSTGIDGVAGSMNAMSLVNLGWQKRFFWNGRALNMEEQALQPVQNPIEMHESLDHAVEKLKHHPKYPSLFRLAFRADEIKPEHIAKAIAQFERTLVSGNSLYDRYFPDNDTVLTLEQYRGKNIFFSERGDCFHCHGGILLNNVTTGFANNGLDAFIDNTGLGGVTGYAVEDGRFKIPSLRNVAFTAPYMHDGRFNTLEEVVEHYSSGIRPSRTLDPIMKKFDRDEDGGLNLTSQEKKDLVAFLKTFSDSSFLTNPAFKNPF